MSTTLNFKRVLDIPQWRPNAPCTTVPSAGSGMAWDHRNHEHRNPYIYGSLASNSFALYHPETDEWAPLLSLSLSGTSAGSVPVFHPSQGPRGTIASGASASSITLSTALAAAVAPNALANRGDGVGYRVRIIDNGAGGSGKTEERTVVANTGGTTPQIDLDTPLSFTPASGSAYEFRGGRLFVLGSGSAVSNSWKHYCPMTGAVTSLGFTNLPANVSTDSTLVALSEDHVPYNRSPGEGFLGVITASASAAGTITGSGMPAALSANEYRNFQVRVVEDTTNTTAVGQRRRIASHTSGASGVFTLSSNWAVQPSATAKFVVENDDDKILLRSSASASVYTYNVAGNTWDTTTFTATGAVAVAAGTTMEQSFGIDVGPARNARHSHIYCIRGGGSAEIDVLDIAGGANGAWTAAIPFGQKGITFGSGTASAYDPVTIEGRYLHINLGGVSRNCKFDMLNRVMVPAHYLRVPLTNYGVGQKMAMSYMIDGSTKLSFVYLLSSIGLFSIAVQS